MAAARKRIRKELSNLIGPPPPKKSRKEQEDEEQSENIKNDYTDTDITDTVVTALRDELKKKEYQRDYLKFRYRGEVCDGVPMLEINPSKFVFKIDDKLVGVKLGEIKIL